MGTMVVLSLCALCGARGAYETLYSLDGYHSAQLEALATGGQPTMMRYRDAL